MWEHTRLLQTLLQNEKEKKRQTKHYRTQNNKHVLNNIKPTYFTKKKKITKSVTRLRNRIKKTIHFNFYRISFSLCEKKTIENAKRQTREKSIISTSFLRLRESLSL